MLVICRSLDYSPRPFLLAVAICANSGAIVTFASGLPNIMIGTAAGIPYVQFLLVSAPYALVSVVIAVIVLRLAFRHDLPWRQDLKEQAQLEANVERAMADAWRRDRAVEEHKHCVVRAEQAGMVIPADTDVIVAGDPEREREAMVRLARIGFDRVVGYVADYEAALPHARGEQFHPGRQQRGTGRRHQLKRKLRGGHRNVLQQNGRSRYR